MVQARERARMVRRPAKRKRQSGVQTGTDDSRLTLVPASKAGKLADEASRTPEGATAPLYPCQNSQRRPLRIRVGRNG
jgi:hypothetical protein